MSVKKTFLTPDEVAALAGVHRQTVHYWIQRGKLPAERIGRIIAVRAIDAIEFINARNRILLGIHSREEEEKGE
jgi:excisionase family DNA binding protein